MFCGISWGNGFENQVKIIDELNRIEKTYSKQIQHNTSEWWIILLCNCSVVLLLYNCAERDTEKVTISAFAKCQHPALVFRWHPGLTHGRVEKDIWLNLLSRTYKSFKLSTRGRKSNKSIAFIQCLWLIRVLLMSPLTNWSIDFKRWRSLHAPSKYNVTKIWKSNGF